MYAMSSRYRRMILEANETPIFYNMTAAGASWTVLAGFCIFPGTFTSLQQAEWLHESDDGRRVQSAVQNIPLIPLASCCYLVGVGSLGYLWSRFRLNYVWLLAHIFFPGILNGLSGLLTMLLNIYSAQQGHWSPPAWATLCLVTITLTFTLVVSCLYKYWLAQLRDTQP
ncbi:PHO85 cyclin-1 [Diaporthe amygdali]|uniref:PHO85 cyclin-1 n=1 Tax=Phomopsis amygdali TaxID=1214568 RepID=UPI0022FECEB9|nr:PHO85 cyclin-1 [Diaporthe amygdali]KAJ0123535.1 PHO85 cyclin-1 [Diaporthe amygdali]